MKQKPRDLRRIATKIATRLFTCGSNNKANRLELKIGFPPFERALGGWSKAAAIDQICDILSKEFSQPQ